MQPLRLWRMAFRPPDRSPEEQFEDFVRGMGGWGDRIRGLFGGGGGGGRGRGPGASGGGGLARILLLVLLLILLGWLATGFYTVQPGEVAVVRRFGQITGQSAEGLHWRVPAPVEAVDIESVRRIRTLELGFRNQRGGGSSPLLQESLMIAEDETLVNVQLVVQYQVARLQEFLFYVKDPEGDPGQRTLRDATESALRQVVGLRPIDNVLTVGKAEVQEATQRVLQELLDSYQTGIVIINVKLQDVQPPDQVQDAFKDVIAARVDKERFQEEARAYQNDVVPKAQGQAAELLNQAAAFEAKRVAEAQGEADRFLGFLAGLAGGKGQVALLAYLDELELAGSKLKTAVGSLAARGLTAEDDAKRKAAEETARAGRETARGRFLTALAVLTREAGYRGAKDVTQQRLYLETIEKILPRVRKFVITPDAGGNLLQLLTLEEEKTSLPSSDQGR